MLFSYTDLGNLNSDPHAYTTCFANSLHPTPPAPFKDTVSFFPSWPQTHHVAKNELKLLIFLLLLPEHLDYKYVGPHLIATNLIASTSLLQYPTSPHGPRHGGSLAEASPTRSNGLGTLPVPTAYPEATAGWPHHCLCPLGHLSPLASKAAPESPMALSLDFLPCRCLPPPCA